jgi:hypothetical protein
MASPERNRAAEPMEISAGLFLVESTDQQKAGRSAGIEM